MNRLAIIRQALERGEQDAQLLDGRDFDARYWQNARRQLNMLRRELAKAEGQNEALRAVIEKGEL